MIKLLSISGSPTEQSSTDILLNRIASGFVEVAGSDQVEHNSIKLSTLDFIPCQACGESPAPKFCFYDDGMTELYKLLVECDCLLIGSPIYFDSVSAQLKTFIDRCNCLRPADFTDKSGQSRFIRRLDRKCLGATVLVGGEQGYYEGARRTIAGFFKWIEVTDSGLVSFSSKDFRQTGSVVNDGSVMNEALELGRQLRNKIDDKE